MIVLLVSLALIARVANTNQAICSYRIHTDCLCGDRVCSENERCVLARGDWDDECRPIEYSQCVVGSYYMWKTCMCQESLCHPTHVCFDVNGTSKCIKKCRDAETDENYVPIQPCLCGYEGVCDARSYCFVSNSDLFTSCEEYPQCTGVEEQDLGIKCLCGERFCESTHVCSDVDGTSRCIKKCEDAEKDANNNPIQPCLCGYDGVCDAKSYCSISKGDGITSCEAYPQCTGVIKQDLGKKCLCGRRFCRQGNFCRKSKDNVNKCYKKKNKKQKSKSGKV